MMLVAAVMRQYKHAAAVLELGSADGSASVGVADCQARLAELRDECVLVRGCESTVGVRSCR